MKKQIVWIFVCLFILSVASCTKNRKSEGLMDDPETHFLQGKKYWEKGDLERAREEFELAKSLQKKYGPAYAGLAMVEASLGHWEQAEDLAEDAVDYCDDKRYEGYMAQAIVMEKKHAGHDDDSEWYEDAEDLYHKALKIAPKSGELFFRMGHMYKVAYQFRKAEDAFRKNLDLKDTYQDEANQEWEVVQKIVRAAPGTRVGSRIALVDKITRADIAALFIAELELDRIMEKRKAKHYETGFTAPEDPREMQVDSLVKMEAMTDIKDHWARNFIEDIQKFQIRGLEPSPDHKFYPNQPIIRSEYAFFIEDILIAITGDQTLATKYLGAAESRFSDVNPGSPYYNAICNAVDKNVMDANLNGEFRAMDSVSGPDALLIIRAIKEMRR